MNVLVVVAVSAELEAIAALVPDAMRGTLGPLPALGAQTGAGALTVIAGGVGQAASAAATATALGAGDFDLVLSVGVAGGFRDVGLGTLVVADRVVAADLGCRTDAAFVPLGDMGLGTHMLAAPDVPARALADRLQATGAPVVTGTIATVSTITGTATAEEELHALYGARAEAMEGFGVATAAELFGIPWGEVRAISNAVGPRDVTSWRLDDALRTAAAAVLTVTAEPLPC